jgi:hypothetical protein
MGRINKTILGRLSGAVGDVLFRQMHGKNYVGTKPDSFIPGSDKNSVDRRKKFGLTVKFSGSVNHITQLKNFWARVAPKSGSPFNFIVKTNYAHILPDDVTGTAALVPNVGFSISATSVSITKNQVQVTLNPIGNNSGIDTIVEKHIQLACVLYFKNPSDDSFSLYYFLPLISAKQALSLVNPLSFSIVLSDQQTQEFDRYQVHSGFFALVTLDDNDNLYHYSNTFLG